MDYKLTCRKRYFTPSLLFALRLFLIPAASGIVQFPGLTFPAWRLLHVWDDRRATSRCFHFPVRPSKCVHGHRLRHLQREACCIRRAFRFLFTRNQRSFCFFLVWFVFFLDEDAVLLHWRGGWQIRMSLAFIGDYYSLFSAQCEESDLGGTTRILRHICKKTSLKSLWLCVMFTLFSFQKPRGGHNKQDVDAIAALHRTRWAALHQSLRSGKSGHIHGPTLPRAVEALCHCASVKTLSLKEVVKETWTLIQLGHRVRMQNGAT